MKKCLGIALLILAMLTVAAHAEPDLAGMTDDELYQLRDAIDRELASRAPAGDVLGVWDTDFAHVELLEVHGGTSFDGAPGAVLIFNYTNTSQNTECFQSHVYVKVFANGIQADPGVMIDNYVLGDSAIDVMPGTSLQNIPLLFTFKEPADSIDVFIMDTATFDYKELAHLVFPLAG